MTEKEDVQPLPEPSKTAAEMFSERVKARYKNTLYNTAQKLADASMINKSTVDKYIPSRADDANEPLLLNACKIAKLLNFSLDEIRDELFPSDAHEAKNKSLTVQDKLLGLLELYKKIAENFPGLSSMEHYKDEPVFVEFMAIIKDIQSKTVIKAIAGEFDDRYFMRHGKITERASFINKLKESFEKQQVELARFFGDYKHCYTDCYGCPKADERINCADLEVKLAASAGFEKLLKENEHDLNALYEEIEVRMVYEGETLMQQ